MIVKNAYFCTSKIEKNKFLVDATLNKLKSKQE